MVTHIKLDSSPRTLGQPSLQPKYSNAKPWPHLRMSSLQQGKETWVRHCWVVRCSWAFSCMNTYLPFREKLMLGRSEAGPQEASSTGTLRAPQSSRCSMILQPAWHLKMLQNHSSVTNAALALDYVEGPGGIPENDRALSPLPFSLSFVYVTSAQITDL